MSSLYFFSIEDFANHHKKCLICGKTLQLYMSTMQGTTTLQPNKFGYLLKKFNVTIGSRLLDSSMNQFNFIGYDNFYIKCRTCNFKIVGSTRNLKKLAIIISSVKTSFFYKGKKYEFENYANFSQCIVKRGDEFRFTSGDGSINILDYKSYKDLAKYSNFLFERKSIDIKLHKVVSANVP